MSHIIRYLLLSTLLTLIPLAVSADDSPTPPFSVWLECVQRGPYEGMAQARINYSYGGEFAVTPEDSRLLGDTSTGETIILNYSIEPGEDQLALTLNVGANKVVTLKIVLFSKLYVVTAYDNQEIPDCGWDTEPEVTPEPVSNA
jgi:hypothetical protein